jgi:predicted XRE-type DNA-binding protein
MRALAAILLTVSCLCLWRGAADTNAAATAQRAANMLQEAASALADADGARDRVEALTETVRAYEQGLLALREGVRQAALRERAILTVFDVERDRLSRLVGGPSVDPIRARAASVAAPGWSRSGPLVPA